MRITFVTPHQRHTSGGVYAIHQYVRHLALNHDVTLAVMKGEPRTVEGATVVPLDSAGDSDVVLYPADLVVDSLPRGRPVCLFQGFGTPGNPDVLMNLARSHLVIATARWLAAEAEQRGCVAYHVPYGIDLNLFHPGAPTLSREDSILMMTHIAEWKGTKDGLEALTLVRSALPDVRIRLFGVQHADFDAEFVWSPDRRRVADMMRQAAVFVCSSWEEGFGMPALEAMACGAALVTTDTKGSRDYALHGMTALVVRPHQPARLAEAIRSLLERPERRANIVDGGHRAVGQYPTWSESARIMEQSLVMALKRT